jgi:hypothetical protein
VDRDAASGGGRLLSDPDWQAVLAGGAADAAVAVLAAVVALPEEARWPAFGGVLAGGLLGGYLAGRLASGPWRTRLRHGLLAGLLGGAVLAAAARWSLQPDTPDGALWSLNYLLATGAAWLPPGAAARYDSLIGVGAALICGLLYVAEGVLAAGAAPVGESDAVAVRDYRHHSLRRSS